MEVFFGSDMPKFDAHSWDYVLERLGGIVVVWAGSVKYPPVIILVPVRIERDLLFWRVF